jgi:flagellin
MSAINSFSPSMIAQRQFNQANFSLNSSLEKLATGFRINRGSDDPAGLIASEQLSAALASLDAESRSMERADAVANTADGALAEISGLLSDANAATVAMANTAGMSQAERDAYQMEIDSAMQSIDRIASTTTFNGQKVLDGSMTMSVGGASVSIGNSSTSHIGQVTIDGVDYRLSDVKSGGSLDPMSNPEGAQQSIAAAISNVATFRGQIGSFQSTSLAPMRRANAAAMENTASAYSMIRDTNYASETANLSRAQLLNASSLRVLSLANASPRSALQILS